MKDEASAASTPKTLPPPKSSKSWLLLENTSIRCHVSWRKREMIAQELEITLHMAFVEARQKRHEFISVEHLLLALLDNPSAAEVLKACAANLEELRRDLTTFIDEHTPKLDEGKEADTQPTLGFQRVIQRAILHIQSSGRKEVTGSSVLVAIFGEKSSHAVYYLQRQGISRLDVVNYISHGITKSQPGAAPASSNTSPEERENSDKENTSESGPNPNALENFTLNL